MAQQWNSLPVKQRGKAHLSSSRITFNFGCQWRTLLWFIINPTEIGCFLLAAGELILCVCLGPRPSTKLPFILKVAGVPCSCRQSSTMFQKWLPGSLNSAVVIRAVSLYHQVLRVGPWFVSMEAFGSQMVSSNSEHLCLGDLVVMAVLWVWGRNSNSRVMWKRNEFYFTVLTL